MTNSYSITINNQSGGSPKTFYLFQQPPVVSGGAQIFSNVYGISPAIASGPESTTTFNITNQYYAIYGTLPQALASGVSVVSSNAVPVTLASGATAGTSLVFTSTGGSDPSPEFGAQSTTSLAGNFQIQSDASFTDPNPNNMYIGVGAPNPQNPNAIVPIASTAVQPSTTYDFQPIVKYYITWGEFLPGQAVNITEVGNTQLVDFTSAGGVTNFTYELNSENEWQFVSSN